MHLLPLQFISDLRAFLAIRSSYTLDGDKLLKRNAVNQLQYTALAFSLLFALLLLESLSRYIQSNLLWSVHK